jgi:hypothetical protein
MIARGWNNTVRRCLYLILGMMALAALPSLQAQTTAALSGRAVDAPHAEVAAATVTLINQATNDTVVAVTGKNGTYSFPVLLPGTYTIMVEAKGFKAARDKGITVYAGSRAIAPDSVLEVGSVSDTVTVESSENILLTENGSMGATLDAKDIEQLALVSRNVDDLVRVLPGVTTKPNGTGNGLPSSCTRSLAFADGKVKTISNQGGTWSVMFITQ